VHIDLPFLFLARADFEYSVLTSEFGMETGGKGITYFFPSQYPVKQARAVLGFFEADIHLDAFYLASSSLE
jgi:hypothetical protein